MKPIKYTAADTRRIDLGSKQILKYPSQTTDFDIGHMSVNGRFPAGDQFEKNKICDFVIYVLEGSGKVYAGEDIFEVEPADVVFVPKQNKYAMEGKFKYLTIDFPAYDPDQSERVG